MFGVRYTTLHLRASFCRFCVPSTVEGVCYNNYCCTGSVPTQMHAGALLNYRGKIKK